MTSSPVVLVRQVVPVLLCLPFCHAFLVFHRFQVDQVVLSNPGGQSHPGVQGGLRNSRQIWCYYKVMECRVLEMLISIDLTPRC